MTVALAFAASAESAPAKNILLEVLEPAQRTEPIRQFPVSVGLVFPEGELSAAPGGALRNDLGRPVPFEAEATGWWSPRKDCVKWLLLKFRADTDRTYYFERGGPPLAPKGKPIAQEEGNDVVVETGPLAVRISGQAPSVFQDVKLDGASICKGAQHGLLLSLFDGKKNPRCAIQDWQLKLEESTPDRAVAHARGFYHDHGGADDTGEAAAQLDLRYEFYRGEPFVRVYHTLTWRLLNFWIGAREISLGVKPQIGESGTVRIGLSDFEAGAWQTPWEPRTQVFAWQDGPEHFRVDVDGKGATEGGKLGGWIAMENADGRGVSVSLRFPWQTWPTALAVKDGAMYTQFYPERGKHMSFAPEDLIPEEYYRHPVWATRPYAREQGHYVHERARRRWYQHTAQGAARTHELTFLFYDKTTRRLPAVMNSVTQHPVVLRQDPKLAMRVPFMGFRIMPYDAERFPDVERALDMIGRLSTGRWASTYDYGLWKFGAVRWCRSANHHPGGLYRWNDGAQYDQQIIPWLLFIRGGDRRWFEEAEITARYLMDIGTNHFNTRGFPPGYMATAAALPFPYVPYHTTKGTKIHYLTYYYHLTGYRRAKEVMDTVVEGTTTFAADQSESIPPWYRRTGGRECYNMNVFWANAWQETFDPRVKEFALEWMGLARDREYSPELNVFRPPQVYLYSGLVIQQRLWKDRKLRDIMLKNLAAELLSYEEHGGVLSVEKTMGAGWAHEASGDERFARVAWDVARTLADNIADADLDAKEPPPFTYPGSSFYRAAFLPIIVGASVAQRMSYDRKTPPVRRALFVTLDADAAKGKPARGTVFIRPFESGDLKLRVSFQWTPAKGAVKGAVLDGERQLASFAVDRKPRETVILDGPGYGVRARSGPPSTDLVIPDAQADRTYRLVLEGGTDRTMALVMGDARIVHHVPPGKRFATQDLAGQYHAGRRLYARTTRDVVVVESYNAERSPYTIRDARTEELIFRSALGQPKSIEVKIGSDRLIELTSGGYGPWTLRKIDGITPYLSATPAGWFDPTQ